ncbi:MAG: hypothetical protein KBA06_03140 [Saprospiraceae bacterium]|nr:hypothetical protein [Saprospiraceae bacterium]
MKLATRITSFIFHPLIIVTYILIIMVWSDPFIFGFKSILDAGKLIFLVFITTFFIPGLAIAMLRPLGFIDSLDMETNNERIIPFIIAGVFYTWMFRNLIDNNNIPYFFTIAVLGATIGLFVAFFINIYYKISIHGVGMGGLLAVLFLMLFPYDYRNSIFIVQNGHIVFFNLLLLMMLIMVITGWVGVSRLYLKAHKDHQYYIGVLVGFCCQVIAYYILMD